jgi:hypothetical protein
MKKASISITCLLLFTATGFSQNNIKKVSSRQDIPVSCLITTENFISGLKSADKPGELFEINQEAIIQPTDKLCIPGKIFKNKK